MRIAIASDHRGVHIKAKLVQLLSAAGHQVEDYGTHGDQSVDYPDYAALVSQAVASSAADRGILICGTGIGMAIAANKFPGVRAATCYDEVMAEICRRHNDVNVLCLPGDLFGDRPVADLVRVWLQTEFESGRHLRRIEKIKTLETKTNE